MSGIYLIFTNLRRLFLTVRSEFLASFLVHSTPFVNAPVQVSSPNTPCLLQTIPLQLSPSHPQIFLPAPLFQHSGPLSLYSQYRKYCSFKAFPQTIWERAKHKCRENLDTQDGNLPPCLHRKAASQCTLPAWCLKNTNHPHVSVLYPINKLPLFSASVWSNWNSGLCISLHPFFALQISLQIKNNCSLEF